MPFRSDPTYKEWKLPHENKLKRLNFLLGSYLQGMETGRLLDAEHHTRRWLGSYLQGMETKKGQTIRAIVVAGSDPTYKEWKRHFSLSVSMSSGQGSDPTYKEWKPELVRSPLLMVTGLGSYLQGMETCHRSAGFC